MGLAVDLVAIKPSSIKSVASFSSQCGRDRKQTPSRNWRVALLLMAGLAGTLHGKENGPEQLDTRSPSFEFNVAATATIEKSASERKPDTFPFQSVAEIYKQLTKKVDQGVIVADLPPKDPWQRAELARYGDKIEGQRYDYIVVPVQEASTSTDRPGRLMASTRIAMALEQITGKRVLFPELTYRLLGGYATRFEQEDIQQLARPLGAKIVYLFHFDMEKPESQFFAVIADQQGAISGFAQRKLEGPTDIVPFERLLANDTEELVAELTETAKRPGHQAPSNVTLADSWDFPETLPDLVNEDLPPVVESAQLQLIAMLTPAQMRFERRRLFERSLYALQKVSPDAPAYAMLSARALFYLGRRPVALTYLEQPKSPQETALKEFLRGNYPELLAEVPKIQNPLWRALALVELAELAEAYDKPIPDPHTYFPESSWLALLSAMMTDQDRWVVPDNFRFFGQMKGLFPAFDELFEKYAKEQVVSGELTYFEQKTDWIEEVIARSKTTDPVACCPEYAGKLGLDDIWSLYRNHGIANIMRRLYRSVRVHGSYERGKEYAESIQHRYKGYPRFMRLYAEALEGAAERTKGDQRLYLYEQGYLAARDAAIYSGEINDDSLAASRIEIGFYTKIPRTMRNEELGVYTVHSMKDAPSSRRYGGAIGFQVIVDYSHSSFAGIEKAYERNLIDTDAMDEILKSRLNGHPKKMAFLARRLVDSGRSDEAIEFLQQEVAQGSGARWVYEELLELLVLSGEYEEAAMACLRYPKFQGDRSTDAVAISNIAGKCGDRLFWLARIAEAIPLYQISATSGSGAGSSMSAAQRLAVMEGDLEQALYQAFQRGQRYNSIYGYRDYLAYLHLLGFHEDALNGFAALAPRFNTPQLWTSQFIGQRMQGESLESMQQQIDAYLEQVPAKDLPKQAQRYMLMQALTDRELAPEAQQAVDHFAEESPRFPARDAQLASLIAGDSESAKAMIRDCKEIKGRCDYKSSNERGMKVDLYSGFVHAYSLLRAGQYDQAVEAFVYYDLYQNILNAEGNAHFALSYAVMAASKVLTPIAMKTLLAKLDEVKGEDDFDSHLARAVLLAEIGQEGEALQALTDAYHHRPHTMERPLYSWYQLTEVAEWISDQTKDTRFVEQALNWAKGYQKIQPQFGWAYAFDAYHNDDEEARIQAAAFAQYLDPQSRWLSQVPESIREKANIWWADHNPYAVIRKSMESEEPEADPI